MEIPYIITPKEILDDFDSIARESIIGRKGVGLALLIDSNVETPSFFILTTRLFREFMAQIDMRELDSFDDLREKILKASFTDRAILSIKKAYSHLNLIGKSWVAVRSSLSAVNYPRFSFSGLLDTYLNVVDYEEIEEAVKRIYLSLFSEPMLSYIQQNKIKLSELEVAIVVQKMVNSEVSGILYSYDPVTEQPDRYVIQAVFGLGDVIAQGELTPDTYTVDKLTGEIIEKKITPQFWLKTRDYDHTQQTFHNKKVELSPVWQFAQKLTEEQIKRLASIASALEKKMGATFVLEWTMTNNKFYILQLKAFQLTVKSTGGSPTEKGRGTSKVGKSEIDVFTNSSPPLLTGVTLMRGLVSGKAVVLTKRHLMKGINIDEILKRGSILVTDFFDRALEPLLGRVEGIIADTGGVSSDLTPLVREANLPTLAGTKIGTKVISTGDVITLDAFAGLVFKGEISKLENAEKTNVVEKEKEQDGFRAPTELVDIPDSPIDIYAEPLKWPLLYLADLKNWKTKYLKLLPLYKKIFVKLNSQKFSKREVMRLNIVKTHIKDSMLLGLKFENFKDIPLLKRSLSAQGIRRSSKVKIVAILDKIAHLVNHQKLFKYFIDGVLLEIPALYKSYGGESMALKDQAFFEFIKPYFGNIAAESLPVLGVLMAEQTTKEMVKLVNMGVNTIVIENPDVNLNSLTKNLQKLAGIALRPRR